MNEHLRDAIHAIAKGDTRLAESFFLRPGGRRYMENISLILLNTLLPHSTEKEEMYNTTFSNLDDVPEGFYTVKYSDGTTTRSLYFEKRKNFLKKMVKAV